MRPRVKRRFRSLIGLIALLGSAVLVAGPPAVATQPSATATAGVVFGTQPIVQIQDQYGNLRSGDSSTVITAARGTGTGVAV